MFADPPSIVPTHLTSCPTALGRPTAPSSASQGELDEEQWRFFLTGGIALDNPHPNPASDWLTDRAWAEMVRLSALDGSVGREG